MCEARRKRGNNFLDVRTRDENRLPEPEPEPERTGWTNLGIIRFGWKWGRSTPAALQENHTDTCRSKEKKMLHVWSRKCETTPGLFGRPHPRLRKAKKRKEKRFEQHRAVRGGGVLPAPPLPRVETDDRVRGGGREEESDWVREGGRRRAAKERSEVRRGGVKEKNN